ncbi:MAG: oxygen-independent coproporphyrinogen III oxidase [Chlamydiota bacterium]
MDDLASLSTEAFLRFNRRLPRYTSYPTAPFFEEFSPANYRNILSSLNGPVSLYIHIPFCRKMCLFCACSVVLNRSQERQEAYVQTLLDEIRLVASFLSEEVTIREVHFGGGTPTNLTEEQFVEIFTTLKTHFLWEKEVECSIEIDPRTVFEQHSLPFLRGYFSRISLGIQDLRENVQRAVKRIQSQELIADVMRQARTLRFASVNFDLIYGLPLQTPESLEKTAYEVATKYAPERIALFSYAKLPELKPHQKAIRDQDLPTTQEKGEMYLRTRTTFLNQGYRAIGMDHFALPQDSLSIAYKENRLYRNFQGYGIKKAPHMLGLGVTSIGFFSGKGYVQNTKDLSLWQAKIGRGELPVALGKWHSEDDQKRYRVIQEIMCRFSYVFSSQEALYFAKEIARLQEMPELVTFEGTGFTVTPLGRLFVRNIASVFDAYLRASASTRYSHSL